MQFNLANVAIFLGVGIFFVWAMLFVSRLIHPRAANEQKEMTYECAEIPIGAGRIQFNFRFYLLALVFLVFDVEVAFVFPVTAVFRRWLENGRGGVAFTEIFLFIGILFVGLLYVWRKGDLSWQKEISADEGTDKP